MKNTNAYNGWKNRQTWNVALWINNDYNLYKSAVEFMKEHSNSRTPYMDFIKENYLEGEFTPDRIKWDGQQLDYKALNEMMQEFIR